MYNQRGAADVRRVFSGKDGLLFDEEGNLLAQIEPYQVQVAFTNTDYQPLGDPQQHEHLTSYKVTLTATNTVIEDTKFIQDVFTVMQSGQPADAEWTFQGVVKGRNGSEERMIFRDCVPSGNIDLQNIEVGSLVKRSWNLIVNRPPELQNLLTAND